MRVRSTRHARDSRKMVTKLLPTWKFRTLRKSCPHPMWVYTPSSRFKPTDTAVRVSGSGAPDTQRNPQKPSHTHTTPAYLLMIAERQTRTTQLLRFPAARGGARHVHGIKNVWRTSRPPTERPKPPGDSISERIPDALTLGAHARRTSGHESPGSHLVIPERFLSFTQSVHASF